jgi:hypothetical protein
VRNLWLRPQDWTDLLQACAALRYSNLGAARYGRLSTIFRHAIGQITIHLLQKIPRSVTQ